MKTIPPYKPIPAASSPGSSPEKELVIDTSVKSGATNKRKSSSSSTNNAGNAKNPLLPAIQGPKSTSSRTIGGSSPLLDPVVSEGSKDAASLQPASKFPYDEGASVIGSKKRKTGGRRTPTSTNSTVAQMSMEGVSPTPSVPDVSGTVVIGSEVIADSKKMKVEVGSVPSNRTSSEQTVLVRSPNVIAATGAGCIN